MTKPKHTPGPWFVEMARRSWADERHLICEVGDRHAVYAKKAPDDPFTATEDACLIATAPRLFKALTWLMDCQGGNGDIDAAMAFAASVLEEVESE